MTVGNYVRHYSVRSGGPAAARAVPALVCREWSAVRGVWWAVCGAGLVHLSCSPRVPQPLGTLSISHVIPSRLFQTLNSQRWNCNVLRRSRKVTVGNYVRGYSVRSGGPAAARAVPALVCREWSAVRGVWWAVCGAGLVHLSCSPRVPQPLGTLSISHVIPSRLFQTLNSQRWNCNVLRRSRKVTVGNYVRGYSVRSGGIFGKCDGLNVSEPTGILATARGCACRRVVPWAYLHVNHDIATPSGIRRNLSETCRG